MLKLLDFLLIILIILVSIFIGLLPKLLRTCRRASPNSTTSATAAGRSGPRCAELGRTTTKLDANSNDSLDSSTAHRPTTTAASMNAASSASPASLRLAKPSPWAAARAHQSGPAFLANAISLLVSVQTVITALGMPVEFYYFGWRSFQYTLSFVFAVALIAVFVVPFVHKIKSRSIYEYLEDKFGEDDRSVKVFTLALAVAFQFFYASLVLFSTALCVMHMVSLSHPVDLWPVALLIGLLSALLATLGLESIVWANLAQYAVLIACNVLIVVLGIRNYQSDASFLANLNAMVNVTRATGHGQLFSAELSPRSRYTIWNCLFGLLAGWITSYGLTQHNFMRIKSAPSVRSARLLFFTLIPFGFVNLSLVLLIGFVALVYFYKCGDPHSSGLIKNQNQLVTKLLTQFYGDYNGLLGKLDVNYIANLSSN
jgi:hypothetical protein